MSSCNPVVVESFENGSGCFVIAGIGNTLLRSHLFEFALIAAAEAAAAAALGMSVQRMPLSPCRSRSSCEKKAKSMIDVRARFKFNESVVADATLCIRPTIDGCVLTSDAADVIDVIVFDLSPLIIPVRLPFRWPDIDWCAAVIAVASLYKQNTKHNKKKTERRHTHREKERE